MDVVILCGGQGTRIRHLLPEGFPKVIADINGIPFIVILMDHLFRYGSNRLILATGYGHEVLYLYFMPMLPLSRIEFSMETKPLGTAGAIRKAASLINTKNFLILNGDTFCDVDYKAMLAYHEMTNSIITVACDAQFQHVGTFIASRRFIDFIPPDCKIDMAEVFTLLGQKHEPVGWFMTGAPFYDIGSLEGLETFRTYWTSKGEKDVRQSL